MIRSTTPSRFKILSEFSHAAVLDRETGLVWERTPSVSLVRWPDAVGNLNPLLTGCYSLGIGGRRGWRLPKVEELSTLINDSQIAGFKLPAGHPFLNIQSGFYWTVTSDAEPGRVASNAWGLNFADGGLHLFDKNIGSAFRWCVRAPGGFDPDAGRNIP